jgi:hypothetical protein
MKGWSVIALVFTTAIIATIPISPKVKPSLGVELSVNQAEAITYRGVYRRAYRRSYYGYYGAPRGYYGALRYYYGSRQPIGGGGGQWYP